MGLDILIESKVSKKRRILSRQFCREMIGKVENNNSIFDQIFNFHGINSELIDKMNVWDVEKYFWETKSNVTQKEIQIRYRSAWQDAKSFSQIMNTLKMKINKDKSFFIYSSFLEAYYAIQEINFLQNLIEEFQLKFVIINIEEKTVTKWIN